MKTIWNSYPDPVFEEEKALYMPYFSLFCVRLVISCNVALVSLPFGVLPLWYLCQMSWHVLN